MKKISLFSFFTCTLLAISPFWPISATHLIYSLKTKFPKSATADQYLPGYYKGCEIDIHEGRTELPECYESQTFSIIFTENIDFSAKGNTVRYLKRIEGQSYSWYDLTLSYSTEKHDGEDKRVYSWTVEKRKENDVPQRIPDHALVILTNPAFVEALTTEPTIPGSVDVILPTIVFKQNLDSDLFQDTINQIMLGPVLDLDAIHKKSCPTCCSQQGSTIITKATTRPML